MSYIVRDATDASNAHFVVYDSGTVRHIGGVEAGLLINGTTIGAKLPVVNETDRGALADLYRDSATYKRPPWWGTLPEGTHVDDSPYKAR